MGIGTDMDFFGVPLERPFDLVTTLEVDEMMMGGALEVEEVEGTDDSELGADEVEGRMGTRTELITSMMEFDKRGCSVA